MADTKLKRGKITHSLRSIAALELCSWKMIADSDTKTDATSNLPNPWHSVVFRPDFYWEFFKKIKFRCIVLKYLQSNWKTGDNGAYLAHEVRCLVHRRKWKQTKANKRDRIGFIRKTWSIKQYAKITADQIVFFHPEN